MAVQSRSEIKRRSLAELEAAVDLGAPKARTPYVWIGKANDRLYVTTERTLVE